MPRVPGKAGCSNWSKQRSNKVKEVLLHKIHVYIIYGVSCLKAGE